MEEDASNSAPEATETTAEDRKQKRGDRGINRWPNRTYSVTEISPKGEPVQPVEVAAMYRNAIGFLVRDNLDITISNWKLVPKKTKKDLWKKLRTRFIFRVESRAVAKEYTMRQCAISFRNWRSELNIKFVKKGLDATKKYKNITATKWKTFGEQKTSEEFLSKSQANSELTNKNIYHHRLGTGGYKRSVPKWRAGEAAWKAAGLPVMFEEVLKRAVNWLRARKP